MVSAGGNVEKKDCVYLRRWPGLKQRLSGLAPQLFKKASGLVGSVATVAVGMPSFHDGVFAPVSGGSSSMPALSMAFCLLLPEESLQLLVSHYLSHSD